MVGGRPVFAVVRGPAGLGIYGLTVDQRPRHNIVSGQCFLIGLDQPIGLFDVHDPGGHKLLGIEFPDRRMFSNHPIHHRLSHCRFIGFIVAMSAITQKIDDDIPVEFHAVIDREAGDKENRLRIIAVHMKDGRLNHVGNVGAIKGRASIKRGAGREPNLVIDHDMNGSPRGIGPGFRHVEGFHDHPLSGKSRIPVDQDRHDFLFTIARPSILAGSDGSLRDGVNDFKMRRIEGQCGVDRTMTGQDVGRKSTVILHIPCTGHGRHLGRSFKLFEQRARKFAKNVD